jgi:hypothetical protein
MANGMSPVSFDAFNKASGVTPRQNATRRLRDIFESGRVRVQISM